jgi:membrane-associated protease RseP (regulator of RpoE activity)
MTYTLGVVFFVVALLVSVMLHEAGHFAMAKRFGMKATRFFVGFGPTLWSFRRGETEYGVKAIPAGGFVKIIGMTQLEELEPGDEDRAFYQQPARQRLTVLAAGSTVHFILAILLLFLVVATTGDPLHSKLTLTVDVTTTCIPRDANASTCDVKKGDFPAPAGHVLKSGDRIEAVDHQRVSSYQQLRARIQASAGRPITLTVNRNASVFDVRLTPVATKDTAGHLIGRIGLEPLVIPQPVTVAGAVPKTFSLLGTFTTSTLTALGHLPHEISQILRGEPRNNGAASVVDIAKASGQIAQANASVGLRLADLTLIVAELNFFVGIFNLLPLLPLDGGHIGIVVFEQVRSRLYRLFGRHDPGRVDLLKVMPFTYAVVAVFIGLSLLLLYAGITNPIKIQ